MQRPCRTLLAVSALALVAASPVIACELHRPAKTRGELKPLGVLPQVTPRLAADAAVPLWPDLGPLSFKVTTRSSEAQRYFDQGLVLAYGFNHAEARRSFQAAQRLDPGCALCFWGEALVLGPNINAPMDPEVNEAALAALERAKSLAAKASPRERGLVAALDERYGRGAGAERAVLDRAYADAMTELARRHPQDLDIATLAAEALMDLSPWDYWEPGGAKGKGRTDELVALLEGVLARNPEHPGAIHLYIHAVEASDRPERAEPYADRLARQNLGTGHLVHMPSHVYYRVGRYRDALETNRRAAAFDEAFLARAPGGAYGAAYYPHNVHFLLVSAQMSGDGPGAIAAAEKLATVISDEAAAKIPMVQPIKAAPLFAHAQFSSPEVVLALPRPSGGFAYVDALWHYARGIAKAASGDLDGARAEAEVLAGIGGGGDLAALTKAGIPAPLVLRLAHHVVLARIAQAEGEHGRALTEWQAASAIEAQLPYMEPPYWYFPVGQSLGAAHLRLGNLDEAEAAFRDSLRKTPNNGLALFGLGEVLKARGDVAGAEKAARGLAAAWAGQGAGLDLGRL